MNIRGKGFLKLKIPLIFAVTGILMFFGNNCGGFSSTGYLYENYGILGSEGVDGTFGNGEIIAAEGERTLAIAHFGQIKLSFLSMAGVTTSGLIDNAYSENIGVFSLDGLSNSVTAPQMLAISKLASEVCDEARRQGSEVYEGVDFAGAPGQFSAGMIEVWGANMSLIFWGGKWGAEYSTILSDGINEVSASTNVSGNDLTRQLALTGCTSMLSSFFAIEM